MAAQTQKACKDMLERERGLYDCLCEHVRYAIKEGGDHSSDSATGALLYGEAKCDGNTNAVCLLSMLTGMNEVGIYGAAEDKYGNAGSLM